MELVTTVCVEESLSIKYLHINVNIFKAAALWGDAFIELRCQSIFLSVCLSPFILFFWGLSLALMSHDQFRASHCSTLLHYQTYHPPPRRCRRPKGGGVAQKPLGVGGDADWGGGGLKKREGGGEGGGGGGRKEMLKSFLAAVLLSASVKRFFDSRMQDFLGFKGAVFTLRTTADCFQPSYKDILHPPIN